MPIQIDTERFIEAGGQYDPAKKITTTGFMSDGGMETYRSEVDLPVSQGRRTVTVDHTSEGMQATETSFYYDSELDENGQLAGLEQVRSALLVKPGDTFTTKHDIVVIGRPKETVTTTFTVFDPQTEQVA